MSFQPVLTCTACGHVPTLRERVRDHVRSLPSGARFKTREVADLVEASPEATTYWLQMSNDLVRRNAPQGPLIWVRR